MTSSTNGLAQRLIKRGRERELLTNTSYIYVICGYYLTWYEGLWEESQRLMDGINLAKHARRDPRVCAAVMGRFKGEDGDIMHLLPLVNITLLDIRIRMGLYMLVALIKK